MSVFDPSQLMDLDVTGSMSTALVQVSPGEYNGLIKEVKPKQVKQKDGEERLVVDVTWLIDSDLAREQTGLKEPTVRQGLFIDTVPGGGYDLSPGKNVGLGKLREALGLNDPAARFSLRMLQGRIAKVQIGSRTDDKGTAYAEIKSIAPLT